MELHWTHFLWETNLSLYNPIRVNSMWDERTIWTLGKQRTEKRLDNLINGGITTNRVLKWKNYDDGLIKKNSPKKERKKERENYKNTQYLDFFPKTRELAQEANRYTEISEWDGIQHSQINEKVRKLYYRRVRLVLNIEVNSKNRISPWLFLCCNTVSTFLTGP